MSVTKGSLARTVEWFEEAVPLSIVDNRKAAVQVGCHLEEVVEMLQSFEVPLFEAERNDAIEALHILAEILKKNATSKLAAIDRKEFLDACADQIVTVTGSAYMHNLDIVEAMHRVNASNFSKFVDGKAIFDANGKIAKGPDYQKPDLSGLW